MDYQRLDQFQGALSLRKNAILIVLAAVGVLFIAAGSWMLLTAPKAEPVEEPNETLRESIP